METEKKKRDKPCKKGTRKNKRLRKHLYKQINNKSKNYNPKFIQTNKVKNKTKKHKNNKNTGMLDFLKFKDV